MARHHADEHGWTSTTAHSRSAHRRNWDGLGGLAA